MAAAGMMDDDDPYEQFKALEELAERRLDILVPGWRSNPQMSDTPRRVAKSDLEFHRYRDRSSMTTFPVQQVDQVVAVTGIEVWSMCAHHLLPFQATIAIGYIADEQVLGLSKFARIAQIEAHRPTSQEELVAGIADAVSSVTGSVDVAVTATGLHTCMTMRGVAAREARMTSSVTRGAFRNDPAARGEWLALLGRG